MGSTGTGRGAAGGGTATGGTGAPQMGGLTRRGYRRQRAATGTTGRVSDEEFIRATGVNPRTGRRTRRR